MIKELEAVEDFCRTQRMHYAKEEPMSKHTTFKIGGPAQLYIQPGNMEQLTELIAHLATQGIAPCYVGRGANLLVRDEGIRGVVISLFGSMNRIFLEEDGQTICCMAGTELARLCSFALEHSLTGMEFAWGIPGSVGGATYMNAGAYGGEMQDVLHQVTHIRPDGSTETFCKEQLALSYRHSIYTNSPYCIAQVCLHLQKGEQSAIRARMDDLITRRKTKQPLEYPSAGSTFKRPVTGYASALIDECGLKGLQVGGAMVSTKHAGFIINYNAATQADVVQLIKQVQRVVLEEKGVLIEPEVKII